MVSDTHDKAVDRWGSGTDILLTQRQPLGVSWDEAIARLMTCPDTNAATDGGSWASVCWTRHCHGTEWKSWRKVTEARQRLNLFL